MMQVADQIDTITIQITGRFDFRVIKEFQQLLGRDPRTWVIDLGGVDYVDSSALGMLLLLLLRERPRHCADQPDLLSGPSLPGPRQRGRGARDMAEVIA